MKYISIKVRPERVFVGYDDHQEIISKALPNEAFVEKVILLERILSFTEEHIFIRCPHDTVQTWQYEGSLEDIKARLRAAGSLID